MSSATCLRSTVAGVFLLSVTALQAATPTHLYGLDGTLADTLGGPSLVSNGGTLGASGYLFGANQGLKLSNALPTDTYTIDTSFSFDATGGYRKIIDFKDLTSDAGFYNLSTTLNFFPITSGPLGAITDGTPVRVTLSRDGATNLVSGYVNGALQFSFTDTSGLATFSAANNVGHFFVDDFATGQGEASAGFVDYIAVYDTALSAIEISTLTPTLVTEPTEGALMLGGLGAIGWIIRRRRR